MKDFSSYWEETGKYIREKDCLGGNAFRAGQRYQVAKARRLKCGDGCNGCEQCQGTDDTIIPEVNDSGGRPISPQEKELTQVKLLLSMAVDEVDNATDVFAGLWPYFDFYDLAKKLLGRE